MNTLPLPSHSGYAEKREVAPRVALIDNFEGAAHGTAHGEMTESVLLQGGGLKDEDVQRYTALVGSSVSLPQLREAAPEKLSPLLHRYIVDAGTSALQSTTENLRTILSEQPSVRVISQSQSQSPLRVAEPLLLAQQEYPGFTQRLGRVLQLPPDASLKEVAEELLVRTETVLRENDEVKAAKREYLTVARELHERGVVHVLPAGNLGDRVASLEASGYQLSPSVCRSLLVNDFNTVVGSLDEQGQPASFNSPRAGTELYGPGTQIGFSDATPPAGQSPEEVLYGNGTSLTVPLVAGKVLQYLEQHPQAGAFEVEAHFSGVSATRVRQGQQAEVGLADGARATLAGDGQVDPFVLQAIGSGFISGLQDDSVAQFVESTKSFRLVLPGESQDVAQVIDCRDNGEGQRKFTLETHFGTHRHVLRAEFADGAWNAERTVEEFHLSPAP